MGIILHMDIQKSQFEACWNGWLTKTTFSIGLKIIIDLFGGSGVLTQGFLYMQGWFFTT
jgi:hypothetical protein